MKEKEAEPQNPLILRFQRLMEAFAKSDDERDFFLNRKEGYIVYVNLDKNEEELSLLLATLEEKKDSYCLVPKLTFYETKKIMEGFINEKIYDIDTKEKLLDIVQSKEARENFLEFLYDHHTELEKWQQYYQERSRIKIIEWLRQNHFHFVFEEDLDLPQSIIEKLKKNLFTSKVPRELDVARKSLTAKAKSYYSNEALNPRPKRGRPPKQIAKLDIEPQGSSDIFLQVPAAVRPFLFISDVPLYSISSFSSKFDGKDENRRSPIDLAEAATASLDHKLSALRTLSSRWNENDDFSTDLEEGPKVKSTAKLESKASLKANSKAEKSKTKNGSAAKGEASSAKPKKKETAKKPATKTAVKKVKPKAKETSKAKAAAPATAKKSPLRSILKSKKK